MLWGKIFEINEEIKKGEAKFAPPSGMYWVRIARAN